MDIKSKLLATLIMSLIIFGGGGYYFYHQFSSKQISRWVEYHYYPPPDIVAPVPLGSRTISKVRKISDIDNTILSELNDAALPSSEGTVNNYSSISLSAANDYGYGSRSRITTSTTNGGSSAGSSLAYGGTSSSGRASSTADETANSIPGASSSLSTTSTAGPMSVPYNTNNPPQALVDSGGDPDPDEMIPVGEGWWVILILAAAYKAGRKFIGFFQ